MGSVVKIRAKEAVVKTATIAVRSLTLNSKQVTLSVFRQLIKEDLIDAETEQLRGVPWGTVNYFWGDCKDNHLHIVWQKGEELRRACVYNQRPREHSDSNLVSIQARRANEAATLCLYLMAIESTRTGNISRFRIETKKKVVFKTGEWTHTRTISSFTDSDYSYEDRHYDLRDFYAWDWEEVKEAKYIYDRNTQTNRHETQEEVKARVSKKWKELSECLMRSFDEFARKKKFDWNMMQNTVTRGTPEGGVQVITKITDELITNALNRAFAFYNKECVEHRRLKEVSSNADAQWIETWASLNALDQLFIAV